MNHVHSSASHERALIPQTRSFKALLSSFKTFILGSAELPRLFAPLFPPPTVEQNWIITGKLIQQTAYGSLSTEFKYRTMALTESDAIQQVSEELRESYPGYIIAEISTDRTTQD